MDWVDLFFEYTEGIASPAIFRLWSGIAAVAGALERRVYTITTGKPAFPNLFVQLVAPPGCGKSEAIIMVEDLWTSCGEFCVAPNNVTKAALVDALSEAARNVLVNETTLLDFHSLLVAAPEFGVLCPSHDLDFLSVLNYIWDNPAAYREKRRGLKTPTNPTGEIDIARPQLTILSGVQPGFLSSLLPEEAWTMGTMSRTIMIYSGTAPDVPLFGENMRDPFKRDLLVAGMKRLSNLVGPMQWSVSAMRCAEAWRAAKMAPLPTHSKLAHYNARRLYTTIKLAIVSSASRGDDLTISDYDFERARGWLVSAEKFMPDVFREMANRSDKQVIDELYYFAWQEYMKRDRKLLHESLLISFLSSRVPSDKIDRIMHVSVQMGMLKDIGEGFYEPSPEHMQGVE